MKQYDVRVQNGGVETTFVSLSERPDLRGEVDCMNAEAGYPFAPEDNPSLGGEIVGVADPSMTIPCTVAQWGACTGMEFQETGQYVVPGAPRPITINAAADHGLYEKPHVWVRHRTRANDHRSRGSVT
ncbi:MAG: hypothetical protein PVSMB7_23410 [Chloroflexota bacterium]